MPARCGSSLPVKRRSGSAASRAARLEGCPHRGPRVDRARGSHHRHCGAAVRCSPRPTRRTPLATSNSASDGSAAVTGDRIPAARGRASAPDIAPWQSRSRGSPIRSARRHFAGSCPASRKNTATPADVRYRPAQPRGNADARRGGAQALMQPPPASLPASCDGAKSIWLDTTGGPTRPDTTRRIGQRRALPPAAASVS